MTVMCNYELENRLSNMMSVVKYRLIWLKENDLYLIRTLSKPIILGRNLEFDLIYNFNSIYKYDGTN